MNRGSTCRRGPDLARPRDGVIRLYEEWNKPDQATAWKVKLGWPTHLPTDVFARP